MLHGAVAGHTGLATASVTSLIDRLEAKRFVRRKREAADRRRVVVELTPTVAASIAPHFEQLSQRLVERCRRYDLRQAGLIRAFLTAAAIDLRDQTVKLSPARRR